MKLFYFCCAALSIAGAHAMDVGAKRIKTEIKNDDRHNDTTFQLSKTLKANIRSFNPQVGPGIVPKGTKNKTFINNTIINATTLINAFPLTEKNITRIVKTNIYKYVADTDIQCAHPGEIVKVSLRSTRYRNIDRCHLLLTHKKGATLVQEWYHAPIDWHNSLEEIHYQMKSKYGCKYIDDKCIVKKNK